MEIIPVIDLREGKAVRVIDSEELDKIGIYRSDPLEQAMLFEDLGAKTIHIADLDGAFSGKPRNLDIAGDIAAKTRLQVQYAGGMRSEQSIDSAVDAGVHRVVIGTAAIRNPRLVQKAVDKYGDKIVVGIDCRDDKVVIEGWESSVAKTAPDLMREMLALGVKNFIYSDVSRDGNLQGPNFDVIEELGDLAKYVNLISCGGVASLGCIRHLRELDVSGVVIGKAFYHGILTFEEAVKVAR